MAMISRFMRLKSLFCRRGWLYGRETLAIAGVYAVTGELFRVMSMATACESA